MLIILIFNGSAQGKAVDKSMGQHYGAIQVVAGSRCDASIWEMVSPGPLTSLGLNLRQVDRVCTNGARGENLDRH